MIIIGIFSLFILIRFPLLEGRAASLNLYEVYADPFIIGVYISSTFYFLGLYQGHKLLRHIRNDNLFTVASAHIVNKIKYCFYILGLLVIMGAIYIRFMHSPEEDSAGFLVISMIVTLIFTAIGTAAFSYERSIRKGIELKDHG